MTSRAAWFAEHILPVEPKARAWLQRAGWGREEVEDLIQESYAKLAAAEVSVIEQPGGYFFRTLRNCAADYLRRKRIVSITSVADISRLNVLDDALDPEEALTAHQELAALRAAIEQLPARCRAVFIARKVEGLSQAETAVKLGVSESTVEKQVARGMRLCAAWFTKADDAGGKAKMSDNGKGHEHAGQD